MKPRVLRLSFVAWLACGCSGQSCSTLTSIPGGFPAGQRMQNAIQTRVSSAGLAAIQADPVTFAKYLFGGTTDLNVPSSCGSSTALCCPGGTPSSVCGPLSIDVTAHPGDLPRLVLAPSSGASRLDVTLRGRLKTTSDVPITIPVAGDCSIAVDTAPGAGPDIGISFPLSFTQNPIAGTTGLVVGDVTITGLTTEDVKLNGPFACSLASAGLSLYQDTLRAILGDVLRTQVQQSACKPCPTGDLAECGPLATACTDKTCMLGNECLQELGSVGRLAASALLDGVPPANGAALDLYAVAGGYGTSDTGGIAFGVLGGAVTGDDGTDRCGPPASPPTKTAIPESQYFQGNTRPDTGAPFDVAIGIHGSELTQLAYAAYDSGSLCATFGPDTTPTLTTDALLGTAPSLAELSPAGTPLYLGLRPQAPPTITLGDNTFDAGGAVTAPLVTAAFPGMELDVYALVDAQPVRVLTFGGDMTLPLGARSDTVGKITPVLGALQPPANPTVKNVDHLTESNATLGSLGPILQKVAFQELASRLGPLELPSVVGHPLDVKAITAVDASNFVGIFANVAPPPANLVLSPGGIGSVTSSLPRRGAGTLALFGAAAFLLAVGTRRRSRRLSAAFLAVSGAALAVSCGSSDGTGAARPESPDGSTAGTGPSSGGSGNGGEAGGANGGAAGNGGGDNGGAAGNGGNSPCGAAPCTPGEVARGGLGQWNSMDATTTRTVATSYDAVLGDLVLVDLTAATPTYRAVDGVPSATPTNDPSGYRGGIAEAGPDVGAWTSVRLSGTLARVAYQDRDRQALRFASETSGGAFQTSDVDVPAATGDAVGEYASLVLGTTPAIAYRAASAAAGDGTFTSELRLARARNAAPAGASDWTTSTLATKSATLGAGLSGTALFVNLLALGDGRLVVVYYDRTRTALVALVEGTAGSGAFTETVLDGADAADRGQWARAVVDGTGNVHVAYQDGVSRRVYYVAFTPGGSPGTPELVDDGVRSGDRGHWVGAGLALYLDGSANPRVVYQDASGANVVSASKDTTWTHTDLVVGADLDGFSIAAPSTAPATLVWGKVDPTLPGSHELSVHAAP
ncbi:MAG TPA: hypothetical protein VHE30_24610 [Polyangiaceae bacterium]|nr:hypothetical protein [Polyangiaceae bacterium]